MDYTGSINRMRLDMVVNAVYLAVASVVSALADASVDAHNKLVYVGGPTCLPGFDNCICLNDGFTSFSRWTVGRRNR